MARYIKQPDIGFPSQSGQNIAHFVEVFEELSPAALQTAMNAFFVSLEALPEFPIIREIDYQLSLDSGGGGANVLHGALVHYILVD